MALHLIKNKNLFEELGFNKSEASLSFEEILRKQFLEKALGEKRERKYGFFFSRFFFGILVVTLITGMFVLGNINQNSFYNNNSTSALLSIIYNVNGGPLGANPYNFPFNQNKRDRFTVTTNEFTYGEAFERCRPAYPFDKNIKKTVTYEYYKDNRFMYKVELYDVDGRLVTAYLYKDGKLFEINSSEGAKEIEQPPANYNLPNLDDLLLINNRVDDNTVTSILRSKIVCQNTMEEEEVINKVEYNSDDLGINNVNVYLGSEGEENLIFTTTTIIEDLLDNTEDIIDEIFDLDLDGLLDEVDETLDDTLDGVGGLLNGLL